MQMPKVHGVIRRRLLVNFRVEPALMQRILPAPFRPKLQDGMRSQASAVFPAGTVAFDCALIMRNIAHEWHAGEPMYLSSAGEPSRRLTW
jgi:hypothetical protein